MSRWRWAPGNAGTEETMRTIKSVLALVAILGVWWLVTNVAASSDVIAESVFTVMRRLPPLSVRSSDGLELIDFDTGDCCEGFGAGLRLVFVVTFIGGLPMALFGIAWLESDRRSRRRRPQNLEPFFLAAFAFQFAASVIYWILAIVALLAAPEGVFESWAGWGLTTAGVVSVIGLSRWHRLRRSVEPAMLSIS